MVFKVSARCAIVRSDGDGVLSDWCAIVRSDGDGV